VVDSDPGTYRSSRPGTTAFGSIGVSLALYAFAAGILAVSAGMLIRGAEQWGPLTGAVSLLVTVTITVAAGLAAESVVSWLIPQGPVADQRSDDRGRVRRSR
jgi:hypothetical protein